MTSIWQMINICFCNYCYYYDADYYYYYLPEGVKISQVKGGKEEHQEELL